MLILGMMARPGGELHVTQLLQLAADGRPIERDRKFVMEPLGQIYQPPAYHPVDCRDRGKRGLSAVCYAARASGVVAGRQFQGISSSHFAAGQPPASLASTSAM